MDTKKRRAINNVRESLLVRSLFHDWCWRNPVDCGGCMGRLQEKKMTKLLFRVQNLLAERNEVLIDLQRGTGVNRKTLYRGPKRKQTIAAIAYYLNISAEELVAGTDAEEVWKKR